MAAEAFAVLGIVANIAQFTEYALALVSDCREIYNSAKGATQENLEVEAIIQSVHNRHEMIILAASDINKSQLSASERKILRHVKSCESIYQALVSTLEDLKERKMNAFPKLDSLRSALAVAFKARTIRNLKERLLSIETEISRETLHIVGDRQSNLMGMMHELQQTHAASGVRMGNQLEDMQQKLMTFVSNMSSSGLEAMSGAFAILEKKIQVMRDEAIAIEWENQVLESLSFEELRERESNIKDATNETLGWIFTEQSTHFSQWLQDGSGIYWVEGKAGSGKSTLMKYVSWHPDTVRYLEHWAGDARLVVARHFFWNSGLPLQKTQRGLLQSLLYQILSDSRSMIREVCPSTDPKQYGDEQLYEIIDEIHARHSLEAKFCIFIDGLDEYEGNDEDIVNAIKRLASSPNVKVCTSSRPWDAFTKAFGMEGKKLVLQNYTKEDMIEHARHVLAQDDRFRKLPDTTHILKEFPEKVAEKAQGVWLWTFLVVRNILRDLTSDDDYNALLQKLENIPGELEDYYKRMLSKLNAVDRREADIIFIVAVDALAPLPLPALPWLTDITALPDSAIEGDSIPMKKAEIDTIYSNWQTMLSNRCRDLLEITHYTSATTPVLSYRVEFLHRTVRDFLYDWYQHTGKRQATTHFNSHRVLCSIMLKLLKSLDIELDPPTDLVFSLVDEFLGYASKLDIPDEIDIDLIDELDRFNCSYFSYYPKHWTNLRPFRPPNGLFEEFGQMSFLALATQARLQGYVSVKLMDDPDHLTTKNGRPLLDYALRPFRVINVDSVLKSKPGEPEVDRKMVETLLKHGADPNEKVYIYPDLVGKSHTVWNLFLHHCLLQRNDAPPVVVQSWYSAAKQLITYGAQVDIVAHVSDTGARGSPHAETMRLKRQLTTFQSLTPVEIFVKLFSKQKAETLTKTLIKMHKKRCQESWSYWLWWSSSSKDWEQQQLRFLNSTTINENRGK